MDFFNYHLEYSTLQLLIKNDCIRTTSRAPLTYIYKYTGLQKFKGATDLQ